MSKKITLLIIFIIISILVLSIFIVMNTSSDQNTEGLSSSSSSQVVNTGEDFNQNRDFTNSPLIPLSDSDTRQFSTEQIKLIESTGMAFEIPNNFGDTKYTFGMNSNMQMQVIVNGQYVLPFDEVAGLDFLSDQIVVIITGSRSTVNGTFSIIGEKKAYIYDVEMQEVFQFEDFSQQKLSEFGVVVKNDFVFLSTGHEIHQYTNSGEYMATLIEAQESEVLTLAKQTDSKSNEVIPDGFLQISSLERGIRLIAF